jgi:large subunit ribosomal protein L29
MKAKEIRELSVQEIENKLRETRETLLQNNLRKHTGQIDKPHTFKAYRKDIARLETILTEKKKAAAAPAAAR